MAATYDPDVDAPKGVRLPLDLETGELIEERWANWMRHDPVELAKLPECQENLRSLRGLFIDCGSHDQYALVYGARGLHRQLEAAGIDHHYEEFDDDHTAVDYRQDVSFPYLYDAIAGARPEQEGVTEWVRDAPSTGCSPFRSSSCRWCVPSPIRRTRSGADVAAMLNRIRAQLGFGSHPSRQLQRDWDTDGEDGSRGARPASTFRRSRSRHHQGPTGAAGALAGTAPDRDAGVLLNARSFGSATRSLRPVSLCGNAGQLRSSGDGRD